MAVVNSERSTNILVSFTADVRMFGESDVRHIEVENVPCLWLWDESSRDAAEYWACVQYVTDNHKEFDWFSVLSWTGSPVKEGANT